MHQAGFAFFLCSFLVQLLQRYLLHRLHLVSSTASTISSVPGSVSLSVGLSVCLAECLLACYPYRPPFAPLTRGRAYSALPLMCFLLSVYGFWIFGLFYYLLSLVVAALCVYRLPPPSQPPAVGLVKYAAVIALCALAALAALPAPHDI